MATRTLPPTADRRPPTADRSPQAHAYSDSHVAWASIGRNDGLKRIVDQDAASS
jgi:hypothetical protein